MRNIRASRLWNVVLTAFALMVMALPSFAQATPTPPDLSTAAGYAALATTAKDGVSTAIGGSAPVAFLLLAVLLGVGVAWRMIKKGAKSS